MDPKQLFCSPQSVKCRMDDLGATVPYNVKTCNLRPTKLHSYQTIIWSFFPTEAIHILYTHTVYVMLCYFPSSVGQLTLCKVVTCYPIWFLHYELSIIFDPRIFRTDWESTEKSSVTCIGLVDFSRTDKGLSQQYSYNIKMTDYVSQKELINSKEEVDSK